MSRQWTLTRDEAELLVDMLEDQAGAHYCRQILWLAQELRELFGMIKQDKTLEANLEA